MVTTSIGRILPSIDQELCINCSLCYKVCPGMDQDSTLLADISDPFIGSVKAVYTGKSNDREIYINAQSGGMVTQTLSYLFDSGKIDAALVVKPDPSTGLTATAVVIDNKMDLLSAQKSIYTPVDLVRSLPLLSSFKSVAVVGIPCHLQGIVKLQHMFPKKYSNITYLFGLVCDRTLSDGVVDLILNNAKLQRNECSGLLYRSKLHYDYHKANIVIKKNGDFCILSPTIRHQAKAFFTPPRCKICYDKMNIQADIVFGDPWGMENIDLQNGESLVIVRTGKGNSIISEIIKSNRASLKEQSLESALRGQGIEKRKLNVGSALKVYEQKGFLLPSYAYLVMDKSSKCKVISYEIDRYIGYEKLDKNFIIEDVERRIIQADKYIMINRFRIIIKKIWKRVIR